MTECPSAQLESSIVTVRHQVHPKWNKIMRKEAHLLNTNVERERQRRALGGWTNDFFPQQKVNNVKSSNQSYIFSTWWIASDFSFSSYFTVCRATQSHHRCWKFWGNFFFLFKFSHSLNLLPLSICLMLHQRCWCIIGARDGHEWFYYFSSFLNHLKAFSCLLFC